MTKENYLPSLLHWFCCFRKGQIPPQSCPSAQSLLSPLTPTGFALGITPIMEELILFITPAEELVCKFLQKTNDEIVAQSLFTCLCRTMIILMLQSVHLLLLKSDNRKEPLATLTKFAGVEKQDKSNENSEGI